MYKAVWGALFLGTLLFAIELCSDSHQSFPLALPSLLWQQAPPPGRCALLQRWQALDECIRIKFQAVLIQIVPGLIHVHLLPHFRVAFRVFGYHPGRIACIIQQDPLLALNTNTCGSILSNAFKASSRYFEAAQESSRVCCTLPRQQPCKSMHQCAIPGRAGSGRQSLHAGFALSVCGGGSL